MSILDTLFGGSKAVPSAEAAPAVVPTPASVPASVQPATSVDEFASLWEASANPATPAGGIDFNITPEQLQGITANLDVTGGITDEMKQRIAAGGQEAVDTMLAIQNQTARHLYALNAKSTITLVQKAVEQANAGIDTKVQQALRAAGLQDALKEQNPHLSDPSIQPLVNAVQAQFLVKFPQASPRELHQMTTAYLNQVAPKLNPGMAAQAAAPRSRIPVQQETDWAEYFALDKAAGLG